jgi:hypothetical protein
MKSPQIQSGAGFKLLLFTLLALLLNGGLTLGICTIDATFLSEIGSERLPYVYLVLPFVMLVVSSLSSHVQTRFRMDYVFGIATLLLAIGSALLGTAMLFAQHFPNVFPWLLFCGKLFTLSCYISSYTLFWNYVDAYFSITEGRRLYGVINAGSCVGIILFGSLLVLFPDDRMVTLAPFVWSASALACLPLVGWITRKFPNLENPALQQFPTSESRNPGQSSPWKALQNSRFALVLALFYFLLPILTSLNEYLCFSVFSKQGDSQQIATLFAQLYGVANGFNLLLSLVVFPTLVARIGVRNLVLLQPLVYFCVFAWFFNDLSFAAAVFGFFAYQSILPSIDSNNANLLFNALPAEQKRSIRTFIEGLAEPVSIALSGGFLLVYIHAASQEHLAAMAAGAAIVVGVVAYLINQFYIDSIQKNLQRNWVNLGKLSEEALKRLHRQVISWEQRGDPQPSAESAIHVWGMLLMHERKGIQAGFLTKFLSAGASFPATAKRLLQQWIERAGNDSMRLFCQELETIPKTHWIWTTDALVNTTQDLASDPSPLIECYLNPHNPEGSRQTALRQLSRMQHALPSPVMGELIQAIDPLDLEGFHHLLRLFRASRQCEYLGRLFQSKLLLGATERRMLSELIDDIGVRSVPILVKILNDAHVDFALRSLALNALARLSLPHIDTIAPKMLQIALSEMGDYERALKALKTQGPEVGLNLLRLSYTDLHHQTLEWALEILAVSGRIPDLPLLLHTLRSHDPKQQANGLETIMEGAGISLFRKIEPFLGLYMGNPEQKNKGDTGPITLEDCIKLAFSKAIPSLILPSIHACFNHEDGLSPDHIWGCKNFIEGEPTFLSYLREYLSEPDQPAKQTQTGLVPRLLAMKQHPLFECLRSHELLTILPFCNTVSGPSTSNTQGLNLSLQDHTSTVLHIPVEAIQRWVGIFPSLGFRWLAITLQKTQHG